MLAPLARYFTKKNVMNIMFQRIHVLSYLNQSHALFHSRSRVMGVLKINVNGDVNFDKHVQCHA